MGKKNVNRNFGVESLLIFLFVGLHKYDPFNLMNFQTLGWSQNFNMGPLLVVYPLYLLLLACVLLGKKKMTNQEFQIETYLN